VCYVLSGILTERFYERYKALVSGMTDFVHLSDYILLTNFKLQNLLNTKHTRGFDRHLLIKSQSSFFYPFRKLGLKIIISQFGTTVA